MDPTSVVAPDSYVSFSVGSEDKRYYLGVDTTAAKAGNYRVAAYSKPCYATIWQVGELWSENGEILPDKNYQRTVWSTYIAEKCPDNANKFLAVGTDRGSWSDLALVGNETEATLWYTAKDDSVAGKHIQGYLYYKAEVASTEVTRYLAYSDLYGFNRLYSAKPAVSQRISIWSRETGDKMSCYFMSDKIEFGYNRNPEGEDKSFAFRMSLELDGDLFRSQFDQVEFYAKEPTIIDDQDALSKPPYNVTFIMGWSSTHETPAKRDTSIAHWPGDEEGVIVDTAMITLLPASPAVLSTANNRWEDDMKTIGASPKNVHDVTKDHEDHLHIHMHYDGRTFDDSARVIRRLYKDHRHTTLNMKPTPEAFAFPYFNAGTQYRDFTFSAKYQDGGEVTTLDGMVVSRSIGEIEVLDLTSIAPYNDTVWVYDEEGNPEYDDKDKPVYSGVHYLNALQIKAYMSDGVTPATWINATKTASNQIRVTANGYSAGATEIRAAMIKYSYTYRHSSMPGDTVRAEGVIWVTQDPNTPPAHGLINFSHQAGKSGLPQGRHDRQQAPEIVYTTYIIPNEPLPLPIHRDHWGYYRWYNYDATNRDKDISQNWNIAETPKNYSEGEFNPLDMYNSTYSHGRFDMRSHFTPGVATNSPAIQHKTGDAVLTKSDSLACDISIYTDTLAVGSLESSTLSALTEPTLSYRQIFDIRPAHEMADRMEQSRKNGTNDTLQKMTVIAPYGRRYHISPESPYKITDGQIEAGHMQYVYYYKPNNGDNDDENMGSSAGLDKTNGANYHRIGLPAKTTGYITYAANLLSAQDILDMPANSSKQVVMVNPRKSTGYIMGKSGGAECTPYNAGFGSITTQPQLKSYIESRILNPGGEPNPQTSYVLTLHKGADGKITLENDMETLHSNANLEWALIIPYADYAVEWKAGRSGTDQWEISNFTASDANLISGINTGLLKLYSQFSQTWTFLFYNVNAKRNGYLTACDYREAGWFTPERYTANPHIKDGDGTEGSASNQGWIFYEVEVDDHLIRHEEHPKWSRRKQGSATWVPETDPSWTSVRVLPNGTMTATYSTTSDLYVDYKLESEHFNLLNARVYLRDPNKEGPSTSAIITEDSIDNHYSVLATLGLEHLPMPGTNNIVTPSHHLQFEHTQFSYHYPVGNGLHEIPAEQRISGTDPMPAKGEYITTNKFEKPGHYDFESCSGAEFGYMFCYNRASKPLVFLDFTMDQPICTDQELTLVANFANPSSDAPHVTAKMYGKINPSDPNWTLIYTFLTGELEQSDRWYQVVLPLAKDTINKYKTFRCVGTVSGTDDNSDAFLLFDRMRLIAKDRPLTSYQKRTTCQNANDSIYIISRIDYRESELEPGSIICYQYQRWDKDANGGAGGYVPMQASRQTGSTTYERLPEGETEVYPGYYKVGMTAVESVTNPDFKSAVLKADYGTIVVPEHNYNPAKSNVTPDPYRRAAIDRVAEILGGGSRASYYDERDRIMSYSEITTAEDFAEDFGPYATPKCKFYVNEGTESNPHWVMYLINRVHADASDNGTFRIAMNYVDEVDNRPNFSESSCSTERIIEVKHTVSAMVDDKAVDNIHWHNYDRADLENPTYAGDEFLPANTAHTLSVRLTPPTGYKTGTEDQAECRFDLVRSFHFMEGYTDMTPEEQAEADEQWEEIYHCSVGEFQRAMEMFREPGDEVTPNPNSKVYRWNEVSMNGFQWNGVPKEKADSAYKLLDRLIKERLLEVGLLSREVYIGNKQDLYFYVRPIPASGTYIVSAHDGTDSVAEAAVCNTPIWIQMHSQANNDSLRLGYDKKFGDAYAVPVIRASAAVANTALPVRVAAISHDDVLHSGIILGFDSTHIVETNDPAWIPGTSTFRYTQDRIIQERLYSGYYKQGDTILFRPVNAAHIAALTATDCECFNYDPAGTTYDPANPREKDQAGTNVFIRPDVNPIDGCNQWHMLPSTTNPDPTQRVPGYQVENNFTLHAGYWYKFKTSFFHTGDLIPYNMGDNPAGANSSFFILALAPDTAIWAPTHDDGENLWNDDDNWTPIVNGTPFHEALARVPMDETDVIIGRPAIENHLPIVDNTLPGDIEKGEVDFGFKTATCRDILFRPLAQIYGQEHLTYRRAFTDVRFQEGTWRTFTPALKNIYSGDMYVPEETEKDMESYFAPLPFTSGSNFGPDHNRVWPYLFYQSFYNQTVQEAFNNTDEEGAPIDYRTKSSAQWIQTNVLNKAFTPGAANAIIAWGPEGNTEDIIVRLPKQESVYHYMDLEGTVDPTDITLPRPAFAEIRQNLAFDRAALNGENYVDYTFTNETPAQMFFFGNATMELIDVYQLCLDNADKLENKSGTSFEVYELTGESAYAVYILNPTTVEKRNVFLAPMRAIGIKAASPATSLTIRLTTKALIPMPSMTATRGASGKTLAPMRRTETYEEPYSATLYISATGSAQGENYKAYITLTESNTASDAFVGGEDAECLLSHNMDDFTFHTPLTMYTVCENRTLMYDSREMVGRVPLGFSMLSDYTFDDRIILSFATEGHWDRPLYLHDALTGDSILIMNGMRISIVAPASDELRYYINGGEPRFAEDTTTGEEIATGIEVVPPGTNTQMVNDQMAYVYDVLGRKVAVLGENDLLTHLKLPTGVYVITWGDKTERVVIR